MKVKVFFVSFLLSIFFVITSVSFSFAQGTIAVSMDIPRYINPGSELTVNMSVERGVTEGYVKIEEFFPIGVVIIPVEVLDAQFSFTQNYLTVVWKDIPKADKLKIKFKMQVPSTMQGVAKIEGRVNFLDNNKLMRENFEDFIVHFQSDEAEEEVKTPIETPKNVIVGEAKKSKGSIEKQAKGALVITLAAKRNYTVTNENEMLVQTEIEQSNLQGFLKYEDFIPMGFKVKSESTSGSTFSFIENKVKFVWSEAPKDSKTTVSYKLIRDGNDAKKLILEGTLQYLDNGESKAIAIKDEDINFAFSKTETPSPTANTEKIKTIDAKDNSKPKPTENKTIGKEIVKNEPKQVAAKVAKTTNEKGLVYKVQICATQNKSEASKVSVEFGITEPIEAEMQDGWHKYTIGSYPNYDDAKQFRDSKSSIPTSPFVTAYYNGKRISVQEAMMISSQKLMK